MTEQRVTELEMKLSFLEDTVTQLDRLVFEQQQQIERLAVQYRQLADKQQTLVDQLQSPDAGHEIPPHY